VIELLSDCSYWLLKTSVKATIVIALIWLIQILLRNRLPAKWHYALWFLLIARLLIPFDLATPLSIFNWTPDVEYYAHQLDGVTFQNGNEKTAAETAISPTLMNTSLSPVTYLQQPQTQQLHTIKETLALIWLAGALVFLLYALWMNLVLWRRVRSALPLRDTAMEKLVDTCCKRLGIRRSIRLCSLADIKTPFWYGIITPRIILPIHLKETLSQENMEHVFMYELSHYKNRDLHIATLSMFLLVLHWFNPFLWLAFFKMHAMKWH
jgi:beta-lactamase regulating signal transducer with metallopeptidase domain